MGSDPGIGGVLIYLSPRMTLLSLSITHDVLCEGRVHCVSIKLKDQAIRIFNVHLQETNDFSRHQIMAMLRSKLDANDHIFIDFVMGLS